MAQVLSLGKAQGYGLMMKQLFGEEPDYYNASDHVKIYYTPDKLQRVQQKISSMASEGPSDVRIDWLPMITPLAIKKAAPYIIGIAAAGFLLGKIT